MAVLVTYATVFLTAFRDSDPVSEGGEAVFLERTRGAKNTVIKGRGHFRQGDRADQFSNVVIDFINS